MDSVITRLWYGDLSPIQKCGMGDDRVEDLFELMERNKEILYEKLEQPQKERFERFEECAQEYAQLMTLHAFTEGFALAMKMMTEVIK